MSCKDLDGVQFRLNTSQLTKQNTTAVTMLQTIACIEAMADAKADGQLFHTSGVSYLNSSNYFKTRVLF